MATNRELTAEISALAEELGIEITTERLNNAALSEMASRLRTQRSARVGAVRADAGEVAEDSDEGGACALDTTEPEDLEEAVADTDPAPVADVPPPVNGAGDDYPGGPPPPAPKKRVYPYQVAPGCSLSCGPRGILAPGKEIRATDLPDGQAGLDRLVSRGYVIKAS